MGVTSWLPRAVLSGAKPSPDSVYQFLYGHIDEGYTPDTDLDSDVVERVGVESSEVVSARKKSPVTAESLHLSATPAKKPAGIPSKAPIPDSNHVADARTAPASIDIPQLTIEPRLHNEKAPRFRLGFWLYKDLLVIDSLPLLSRGGITQDRYQALCANMVTAMGLNAELLVAPYVLAWPMLAGSSLDQGRIQASLAVNHKIQKLLQLAKPRLILFLGEPAAQMSMQRTEGLDELRAVVFNYSSQIKAVTSLSLTQMIQIPECKKEVWSDLQKVLPADV
jgi:uracil-DNA glycosylase family 4